MRAFMRQNIQDQQAQLVDHGAVIRLVTAPSPSKMPSFAPNPTGDIAEGPKPKLDPLAGVRKAYGKLAETFADPDAFLQRIADGDHGVKRLADAVIANPEITKGLTESRFESLLTVRNNVLDDPDSAEFLQWGMSLRENELNFVGEMGGMKSSRMKSFVKTARLVFGGPGALNVDNPVLVKVAKTQIRNQPEGAVARHTYAFATQVGVAKLSPTQRARAFVTAAAAIRQKDEIEDIREDLFKDNISDEERMIPDEQRPLIQASADDLEDPFEEIEAQKQPENEDALTM